MQNMSQADFAFTGFLAAQQARYATTSGRRALEQERRTTLTPVELAWQRHVEAADRAATQRVIDDLDMRRLTRDRMLAEIDEDYIRTTRFKTALNEGNAA